MDRFSMRVRFLAEATTRERRERFLAVDRLAAFVDGVFAIAATLLALEVTVPVVHEAAAGEARLC